MKACRVVRLVCRVGTLGGPCGFGFGPVAIQPPPEALRDTGFLWHGRVGVGNHVVASRQPTQAVSLVLLGIVATERVVCGGLVPEDVGAAHGRVVRGARDERHDGRAPLGEHLLEGGGAGGVEVREAPAGVARVAEHRGELLLQPQPRSRLGVHRGGGWGEGYRVVDGGCWV